MDRLRGNTSYLPILIPYRNTSNPTAKLESTLPRQFRDSDDKSSYLQLGNRIRPMSWNIIQLSGYYAVTSYTTYEHQRMQYTHSLSRRCITNGRLYPDVV